MDVPHLSRRLAVSGSLLLLGCKSSVPRAVSSQAANGALAESLTAPASGSANPPPDDDAPIDAVMRSQIIDAALQKLAGRYLFPDVAAKMVAAVRAHQKHGDYD